MNYAPKALLTTPFIAVILALSVSADDVRNETRSIEAEVDYELNQAFQHLIEQVRAQHADDRPRAELVIARLRASQRAWLQFRDAQIGFVVAYHDIGSPSARAAGAASYGVELTQQRIKDLEQVPNPF